MWAGGDDSSPIPKHLMRRGLSSLLRPAVNPCFTRSRTKGPFFRLQRAAVILDTVVERVISFKKRTPVNQGQANLSLFQRRAGKVVIIIGHHLSGWPQPSISQAVLQHILLEAILFMTSSHCSRANLFEKGWDSTPGIIYNQDGPLTETMAQFLMGKVYVSGYLVRHSFTSLPYRYRTACFISYHQSLRVLIYSMWSFDNLSRQIGA